MFLIIICPYYIVIKMKVNLNTKLETVENIAREFENKQLDRVLLIACQHILKTNCQMFNSLFEKGLKPKNVFLMGKCYSTDKEALNWFIEKGVNVHKNSEAFDSHSDFDISFNNYIKEFLKSALSQVNLGDYERVIILDDGAHMLNLANRILKSTKNFVGIEQTSSGYNKLKNQRLRFPVINVARSKAKLDHESPIVADLFVKNLELELKDLKKKAKNILIIGNGPIGKSISDKLSNKCSISIYDKDALKSDFKDKKELKNKISRFDLIIGCTGESSFPTEFYSLLKEGVVLASASSSDREFSAKAIRVLGERYFQCHRNFEARGIHILNSGFPLTFTRKQMGAEGKNIQLTRALIFSSIFIALKKKRKNEFLEINPKIQEKIISSFRGGKE
jgi:S-adenosylhomocysteine hydrolase